MAAAGLEEVLSARPLTAASVPVMLKAVRAAKYRQASDADREVIAEQLRTLRDDMLDLDLAKKVPHHHREGLIITMKELHVEPPSSWLSGESDVVAPAVSKETFRGEKHFSLLLKAGLLRPEISDMRDGLNILAAQSSLGLCLEARALFVTVAWTHKSPLLADAAARSKSSFLRVELDFCATRFPKLSRRERLIIALAHTHAAGTALWCEDCLPAWDQFHAWLVSSVIAPLAQDDVSMSSIEDLVCDVVWPAAESETLRFCNTRGENVANVDDEADTPLVWSSAVPATALADQMRKLSMEAQQRTYHDVTAESGTSISETRQLFQTALRALSAYPLPLNWDVRANQLEACPFQLAVPGLCPLGAACPLPHHDGPAWWDAHEYVFGADSLALAVLRNRLAGLSPPSSQAAPPAPPSGVPQSSHPHRASKNRKRGGGNANRRNNAPRDKTSPEQSASTVSPPGSAAGDAGKAE